MDALIQKIAHSVKPNAFIQGGAYRIDNGPTPTETRTFELAMRVHRECQQKGIETTIGCLVNDLGLKPGSRPKQLARKLVDYYTVGEARTLFKQKLSTTTINGHRKLFGTLLSLPEEYRDILYKEIRDIQTPECKEYPLRVHFESTLRNAARADEVSSLIINEQTGFPVAVCESIMGRFYHELAKQGHPQQIGFYAQEPKPEGDNSCPWGPTLGAEEHSSGYPLRIEVINYWVYPGERIEIGGVFQPEP